MTEEKQVIEKIIEGLEDNYIDTNKEFTARLGKQIQRVFKRFPLK